MVNVRQNIKLQQEVYLSTRKIIENIFSNWANLGVTVILAFIVSPIVVKGLGNETYGILTIITSFAGYFTVLDFGVNTAIIRYISSSCANNNYDNARSIYSTSIAIFSLVTLIVVLSTLIFGYYFQDIFKLYNIPRTHLYVILIVVMIDFAIGLISSVYLGCLCGLQDFLYINANSIVINIVKNIVVIYCMLAGYGLLTLVIIQASATLLRGISQYFRIRRKYCEIYFKINTVTKESAKTIYSYSVYSFIIAIAIKVLFYTDSFVIASLVSITAVTFFAIPSTLMGYLEQLVWAMLSVLVPVISANDALGDETNNVRLYIIGTKYTLLLSIPIVIFLFHNGGDFLRLWIGNEFEERSKLVLQILLLGYAFSMSQGISNAILKGISKHKMLAFIYIFQALANLGLSIMLANHYGIEGVALGTTVPLIVSTMFIIIYTCKVLKVNIFYYIKQTYLTSFLPVTMAIVALYAIVPTADNYMLLILNAVIIFLIFAITAYFFMIESDHRYEIKKMFMTILMNK